MSIAVRPTMNLATIAEMDSIRRSRQGQMALVGHRLMVVMLMFVAGFAAVAGRVVQLSIVHTGSRSRRGAAAIFTPPRADIVDRNGLLLARTIETYSVGVRPQQLITPVPKLARQLHDLFAQASQEEIERKLRSGSFQYLGRRVRPEIVQNVNALGDPGLEILREPQRIYPQGPLAAHVIGSTDIDGIGTSGVELSFNKELSSSLLHSEGLELSIDARVQETLEHELGAAMSEFNAIGASGVVLNARTGEILAMTSLPQFDPNALGQSPSDKRFNRATLGVYELGSTFKAMTLAMAFDTGVIHSMSDRYDARAPLAIGGFRIHDDHAQNRWLSIPEIFAYSSNIGAARIADQIGAARQRNYLDRLGFLDPVAVELQERGRPLSPAEWSRIATMTVGFGHGIAVTPLHLATAYAALVNGGLFRPATLLKQVPGKDGPTRRVFSEETSEKMRALMRLVVLHGTGRQADAKGYRVGGKTGTAEKPQNGRYNHHALISTFAGAFPMDDPNYVVVAILDEPKGNAKTFGYATGGWVSAPVVRRVIEAIAPMLGLQPDPDRDIDLSSILPLIGNDATP